MSCPSYGLRIDNSPAHELVSWTTTSAGLMLTARVLARAQFLRQIIGARELPGPGSYEELLQHLRRNRAITSCAPRSPCGSRGVPACSKLS